MTRIALSITLLIASYGFTAAVDFSTSGNAVRNIVPATVGGSSVLFISELDGTVGCYSQDGAKLWRNETSSPAIMFEIVASDLDGDGNDELLAASGDGSIHCWSSDGGRRWQFTPDHRVRFSEIAVVHNGNEVQVFAGGNDSVLYELDSTGKLKSETKLVGVTRKLEAGNFRDAQKQCLFVMTMSNDKFGFKTCGFMDAQTKKMLVAVNAKKGLESLKWNTMLTDFSVADIDGDQKDDILLFGVSKVAEFFAYNGDLKLVAKFTGSYKESQRYGHAIGTPLMPARNEIAIQYGGIIYAIDTKGKLLGKGGSRNGNFAMNDMCFDAESKSLVMAGEVGGGNGVYSAKLDDSWWKTERTKVGRESEVQGNLNTLYQQALKFTPPAYQKRSTKPWVMITAIKPSDAVKKLNGNDIFYCSQDSWSEGTPRDEIVAAIGKDALKIDKRRTYDKTRDELIEIARRFEKENKPFTVWAGHGTDPFFIQVASLEGILEAAPTTCYGFVYAELHGVDDPRTVYFIEEYMPRLAKAIRKQGRAKLYFRNKNFFWAMTSHEQPWKDVFFSGKYKDIVVPCAEDTSSRTQELNLVGRVGMFAGGFVDDFGIRLVDDNPTSWRPLTPGGQSSVSPYLRSAVLRAAYGARYGVIFSNKYIEKPGMDILFALMGSGAIPIVEKEDIASISAWHLIKDANHELIHSVDDHHRLDQYAEDDDNAVFSVAQMHWAGAALPDHDFSKIALGIDYRWLNFVPALSMGMVPIAPVEHEQVLKLSGVPYFVSDGKNGVVDGQPVPAKSFAEPMNQAIKAGIRKLPLLVSGASWSAIRVDKDHLRVILIDPGYITPQDRTATVYFNQTVPAQANDILANEQLPISGTRLSVEVPAGSMRFIDLTYN